MDAKLLRRDMLTIMGLLDNLQENWPSEVPLIPYIKPFRLRLAKSSRRSLPRNPAGYGLTVDVRLPKAETFATAITLLKLLADKPKTLGIQNAAQFAEAVNALVKLIPVKHGKRKQKLPTGFGTLLFGDYGDFHPTTKWRRRKKLKELSAANVLLGTV
jgi:hypothetical protein